MSHLLYGSVSFQAAGSLFLQTCSGKNPNTWVLPSSAEMIWLLFKKYYLKRWHIWCNQFIPRHLVFLVLLDKIVKFGESFSPVGRLFLCALVLETKARLTRQWCTYNFIPFNRKAESVISTVWRLMMDGELINNINALTSLAHHQGSRRSCSDWVGLNWCQSW